MCTLTIIPARKGSKRLPHKNLLALGNKPMIQWTIEAALEVFDTTLIRVSTDCESIQKHANEFGALAPSLRPSELGTDDASSLDVVKYTVESFENETHMHVDNILLLQPTSPLRNKTDIENALDIFNSKKANAVVSVVKTEHPPQWCFELPASGWMDGHFQTDAVKQNSQSFEPHYRLNGALYLVKKEALYKFQSLIPSERTVAYPMPAERSIDIDTKIDFLVAESLIQSSA